MKELERLNSKSLEKDQLENFWGGAQAKICITAKSSCRTVTVSRNRNCANDGGDNRLDF